MPARKVWITHRIDRLDVRVAMFVGGMFEFISGAKRRGPQWPTDVGLEWFTHLGREPSLLGIRYWAGSPPFVEIV